MELLTLSMITGSTTLFGVMLAVFFGQPGKRILAFYLGLSSGLMALLIIVELLPASFRQGPIQAVGIGLGLGLVIMIVLHGVLHMWFGHQQVRFQPQKSEYLRMGISILVGMAAHNIPEGIAIGAGYDNNHHLGVVMALSIALHNIPEGIGMAIPLLLSGTKRRWIFALSFGVSILIPVGAMLGKTFFVGSPFLVSMGMAFAAGAMGFIVWKEIAPASMKYHPLFAQLGMAMSLLLILLIRSIN